MKSNNDIKTKLAKTLFRLPKEDVPYLYYNKKLPSKMHSVSKDLEIVVMFENQKTKDKLIGVISDTHNLLRPEAVEVLKTVDLIIHAGDICNLKIFEQLKMIAPAVFVRGNNDKGLRDDDIPIYKVVEIDEIFIYIIHDIKEMNIYPAPPGINVVISGHSHQPLLEEHNNILYLNPGSAGPRRFNLPVSIAMLKVNGKDVKAEVIQLLV